MRFIFTAYLLILLATPVSAQIEISGRVIDAESGTGLPAATVQLEGTFRGTITNNEGYFKIELEQLPARLIFRYIGFESDSLNITENMSEPVEIALKPTVTELGEIVVTEKDPGLSIMEIVIERKKLWRATLTNYRVDAYTRQSISNDTSIVSISESSSIAYWDENRGHKEIQISKTQTSNISEGENFAGVSYMPNFYDDNIEIAGYNMVGITHPNATRFYQFKLLETSQMDGKPVYKIEVTPRRELQPLFVGVAWVLGRDYALLEVDLRPNDVVNFPPPVQDFELAYKQQYSDYGGEYWLPVDMRVEGLIRIGLVGLRFPAIYLRQVSRLSDYEINVEIPDSVFAKGTQMIRADSSFIEIGRIEVEPIPLTEEELIAYETIDSTRTLEEAFKPEGFLAKMLESSEERDRSGRSLGLDKFIPKGLSPVWRYNRMEGHHVGLKYDRQFNELGLRTELFSGYSFHSEEWDIGVNVEKKVLTIDNTRLHLLMGFENQTSTRFISNLYTIGMNSLNTLLGSEDYFDYYRNERFSGGLRVQNIWSRTDLTMIFQSENHSSFDPDRVFDNSVFGWHKKRRDHIVINNGTLQSARFEIGYNLSSQTFGLTGHRQIRLMAEFSSDKIGSDFNFNKYAVILDWNVNTFYKRRLFANTLDLHLSAGTATGHLPLQRFGTIDGSMTRFSPFGSLKTRLNLPYEGKEYWLVTAEHNFRTIPFELLGLKKLADKGWGIIIFGGAGESTADGKYPDNLMISDGIHSEIGISLNSVFGILRIDFAKRLDQPETFIGFSVPRYF